ncbi:MAG: AbrB/MazE/SpoVT family DNA-binding domain-containing protein [Ruminococcaceae bacterium]|nr:AbrB/MazE/SpoVT family DNA-binding domain-containing protein [Oscillospiraceae bacterium]
MLKPVGNIAKVDGLGRILIPVNVRRMLGLSEGSQLEVLADEDSLVLKKYIPQCIFCTNSENLIDYKDNYICSSCLEELSNKH